MSRHWRMDAELLGDTASDHPLWGHLGEDENGDLCVPAGSKVWLGRFNAANPWHWLPWLRSRLSRKLAYIESFSHQGRS